MKRQTLLREFADAPPQLAGGLRLHVDPISDRRAVVLVQGDGNEFRGKAAPLSIPYPSGLRRLRASAPDIDVVLLARASRGLDLAARQDQVSYLDLGGHGRLVAPGFVYVVPPHRGGRPGAEGARLERRGARSPGRVSPFAPKASRIVRALLSEPSRRWRLSELATECRMNPGNVHRVLRALEADELVERDDERLVVPDAGSLLEAWAEQARRSGAGERTSIPVHADVRDEVESVLGLLDGAGVVSGELAAELYAPHLTASHALIHCVDDARWDRERLAAAAVARPVRSHGQISVSLADAAIGDFGEHRDGLPLAAAHQVYVDLYRERSRAREAAEHLRRETLGY